MCANLCAENYCSPLRRSVTEEEAQGKPCEQDGMDSRFEPVLSEFQVEAIQKAILRAQLHMVSAINE